VRAVWIVHDGEPALLSLVGDALHPTATLGASPFVGAGWHCFPLRNHEGVPHLLSFGSSAECAGSFSRNFRELIAVLCHCSQSRAVTHLWLFERLERAPIRFSLCSQSRHGKQCHPAPVAPPTREPNNRWT